MSAFRRMLMAASAAAKTLSGWFYGEGWFHGRGWFYGKN